MIDKIRYSLITGLQRQEELTLATDQVSAVKLITVEEFFVLYEQLRDIIPLNGISESHEYLLLSSANKLGIDLSTQNTKELQEEITRLRENEVALLAAIENIQNANFNGTTDYTSLTT